MNHPPVFDALTRSNPNMVWGMAIVTTLWRWGLREVVISPGSRSAPLTLACSRHPDLETFPVLDERSAAFLALGLAKRRQRPVALVCTSGTAGANYFPALIEAHYSGIPLMVLTADRPHELRECHSGQTIRQVGLFGDYPEHESELPFPDLSEAGLIQLIDHLKRAWTRQFSPRQGFVHLNVPFRDPLHPTDEGFSFTEEDRFLQILSEQPEGLRRPIQSMTALPFEPVERGILVAGPAQPENPERYCRAVARLAEMTGYPILAEALSPLRNFSEINPYLISGYDVLLRNKHSAEALVPEQVVQLGSLPTSKVLRNWLGEHQPETWLLDPQPDDRDPLKRSVQHLQIDLESILELEDDEAKAKRADNSAWLEQWIGLEQLFRERLRDTFWGCDPVFEGKIPWMLANALPEETAVIFSNSMPVRDAEYFWPVNDKRFEIFFSRGANGIDGTLSHALGVAHEQAQTILVTGDLAFLHDSNGLLFAPQFEGTLTILLIQNHGGAIFENLPVSQFREGFREHFLTPQSVNFQTLLHAHGIPLLQAETWEAFSALLMEVPRKRGIRVIEIVTDPQRDVPLRRQVMKDIASALSLPE